MAIFFGHFEAMRWAKGNGCPWTENEFYSLLRKGNISIIEEFLQDEPRHDTNRIFQEALSNESSNDDSKVIDKLKLLHRYGYRWDANTTLEAAKQGRLQVLQWLRYIGCDLDVDSCIAAVRSKKILTFSNIYKGLRTERFDSPILIMIMMFLVGNVHILI